MHIRVTSTHVIICAPTRGDLRRTIGKYPHVHPSHERLGRPFRRVGRCGWVVKHYVSSKPDGFRRYGVVRWVGARVEGVVDDCDLWHGLSLSLG